MVKAEDWSGCGSGVNSGHCPFALIAGDSSLDGQHLKGNANRHAWRNRAVRVIAHKRSTALTRLRSPKKNDQPLIISVFPGMAQFGANSESPFRKI